MSERTAKGIGAADARRGTRRRLLSLVVSASMVMSLVPAPALAEMMGETSVADATPAAATKDASQRQQMTGTMGEETPAGNEAPVGTGASVVQDVTSPEDKGTDAESADHAPSSTVDTQAFGMATQNDVSVATQGDENDLGNSRWSSYFSNGVVACTGAEITADMLKGMQATVVDYSASLYLVEGTDFVFDHFEDASGNEVSPKEIGDYYAIYKGVGNYSGSAMLNFRVVDQHDLSYARLEVTNYYCPLVNGVATPQVRVTDCSGKVLSEGTDYSLEYYAGYIYDVTDDNKPVNVPNQAGTYSVRAVPAAGSSCQGHTYLSSFNVYDPNDISRYEWRGRFYPSESVELGANALPSPVIYCDDSEDANASVRLVEGKDYVFDRIVSATSQETFTDNAVPKAAGGYNVYYKGIGAYSGERSIYLNVQEVTDIGDSYWTARFPVYNARFYTDGAPVDLPSPLISHSPSYGYEGDVRYLTQGVEFELDHFESSANERLGGVPSTDGTYYAVYVGKEPYTGERKVSFSLCDTYNLSNANVRLDETNLQETGAPVKPSVSVRDANGIKLQEGVDYSLTYYDRMGNQLASAPSTKGGYYVGAVACDERTRYTGMTPRTPFTIGTAGSWSGWNPFGAITLGQEYSLQGESATTNKWSGSFTPQTSGDFSFKAVTSSWTSPIKIELFADEECSVSLGSSSTYGVSELTRHLESGQTTYWRLDAGSVWDNITFSVSSVDSYDLSLARVESSDKDGVEMDGYVAPKLSVLDVKGVEIDPQNYTLKYERDGTEVEGITSPGGYYVWAEACGNPYHGETPRMYLYVSETKSLRTANLSMSTYSLAYTGAPQSPGVTVTDNMGRTLTEGVDYQLVFYQTVQGVAERLQEAPTEPESYMVAAEAAPNSVYTGRTTTSSFVIVDQQDISRAWNVSFADVAYTMTVGFESVPVYRMTGQEVRPRLSVYSWTGATGTVDSDQYSLSYSNNTSATKSGEFATVTVTPTDGHKGSITKCFRIVDKYDMHDLVRNSSLNISNTSSLVASQYSNATKQFLTTGWDADPYVRFSSQGLNRDLVQNRDFTVSFAKEDGTPLSEMPKEEGKYRLVLTATEDGNARGAGYVSFTLVSSRDLRDNPLYPSLSNGFKTVGPYAPIGYGASTSRVNDTDMVAENNFFTVLQTSATALIENLDYVLTTALDNVKGYLTLTFKGKGQYEGTVRQNVYVATSHAQEFASRGATVRDSVYVDTNGTLHNRGVYIEGLTEGTDYTFEGYEDENGSPITTAEVGDTIYAVARGIGLFADESCVRKVQTEVRGTVEDWTDSRPIDRAIVSLEEGIYVQPDLNSGGVSGPQWYLLRSKSTNPVVALVIYGNDGVRMNGNLGYTVSSKVNGSTAQVKVDALSGAPITGRKTLDVTLVDTYELPRFCRYVNVRSPVGVDTYTCGSDVPVRLTYSGVGYRPTYTIPFGITSGMNPQTTQVLKDDRGNVVEKITGVGSYTLEITGTGEWSGSLAVPLEVTQGPTKIDMGSCTISVGANTELKNEEAKPSVTVRCGDEVLTAGTDYTVSYGSNTVPGSRGYVTATATPNGRFSGSVSANFTVGETHGKNLRNGSYMLRLTDAMGNTYKGTDTVRRVFMANGKGPKVEVLTRDFSGNESVVPSSFYDVEYGPLDKDGLSYVKVTGRQDQGYTGVLSANFNVLTKKRLASSISLAPQTKTFTGKALSYSGAVTKSGSTGAVTYAYYSDKACTKSVASVVNAGTYYVVATLAADDEYEAAKSGAVAFTVAPANISGSSMAAIADQTYSGRAITPAVTVTLGGRTLVVRTDYTVSYKNNENIGTATVTVKGTGNYTGTKSAEFKIVAKAFKDVPANAWYAGVVSRAVGLGLLSGYSGDKAGLFGPDDNITRGQVAVILWNMAKKPAAGAGAKTFPDVKDKDYFYNAVRWAGSVGVVSGYADGRFGPNDNVTREQFAAMLASYYKNVAKKSASGSAADYASMADRGKVSAWAAPAVGWCFRSKILSGSNGKINPQGNATRAQAAKMVVGLYDLL